MISVRRFWENSGQKILIGSALLLALALAFLGGVFFEKSQQREEALIVRIPEYNAPLPAPEGQRAPAGTEPIASTPVGSVDPRTCTFVGSKNSDKYHLPHCAAAKRIKPANLRCFKSEEDAKSAGYIAGCLK